MRAARSLSVRFLVNTSSAVKLTVALPVPFEILKLSAVSPAAMPAGIVPPAKAMSLSWMPVDPVLACVIFCPAVVIR